MRVFRLLRLFFPGELSAGLFYLGLSYLPQFLAPRDYGYWGSLFFGAFYYLGIIYLADYTVKRLSGRSAIARAMGTPQMKWQFIRLGLIGAVPFSLAVCDFGALWYFPYWSPLMYYTFGYLLLGWVFYFLSLTIAYMAFKLLLDRILPHSKSYKRYFVWERKNYKYLGVIGGWFAIMVITVGLQNTRWLTHFNLQVNAPEQPLLYWYWWLIAVGAWILLCEFVCYHKRRSSLLKATLHGYMTPLIAVTVIGLILGVTNEIQNLPIHLWAYSNYPWPGVTLFDVPLFVILAWPLHIIAFIEFWRAFGDPEASKILFEPPSR